MFIELLVALMSGPGMIRTCGTWFRKPLLYPLSYGAAFTWSLLFPAKIQFSITLQLSTYA